MLLVLIPCTARYVFHVPGVSIFPLSFTMWQWIVFSWSKAEVLLIINGQIKTLFSRNGNQIEHVGWMWFILFTGHEHRINREEVQLLTSKDRWTWLRLLFPCWCGVNFDHLPVIHSIFWYVFMTFTETYEPRSKGSSFVYILIFSSQSRLKDSLVQLHSRTVTPSSPFYWKLG